MVLFHSYISLMLNETSGICIGLKCSNSCLNLNKPVVAILSLPLLIKLFLFHFRSATKYFFLNVVLNLAFGVLLGDPLPSIQETMGALVILLSFSVVSLKASVVVGKGSTFFFFRNALLVPFH